MQNGIWTDNDDESMAYECGFELRAQRGPRGGWQWVANGYPVRVYGVDRGIPFQGKAKSRDDAKRKAVKALQSYAQQYFIHAMAIDTPVGE